MKYSKTQIAFAIAVLVSLTACDRTKEVEFEQQTLSSEACRIVLNAPGGESRLDEKVRAVQDAVRQADAPNSALERLGWLFVAKARVSHDAGYYKLAGQAAACMESGDTTTNASLLLRGHVLQSLHRFQEAEHVARRLVMSREFPFDYGLLGDALMEQGRLEEAAEAYQTMIDLKPGLESYSRAAHLFWLKGRLESATELMRRAARSGSPRNGESVAWAYSRLSLFELQRGAMQRALKSAEAALSFQPDYAPALLAQGRIRWSEDRRDEAVELISRAVSLHPLPEYQWWLADVLRATGREGEALAVEREMRSRGVREDSRTMALFFATRGEELTLALRLVQQEMEERQDLFTLDALAWALYASGRAEEAWPTMERALAPGAKDARLFFHAGVIALEAGKAAQARQWLRQAHAVRQMLLPSEEQQLIQAYGSLSEVEPSG